MATTTPDKQESSASIIARWRLALNKPIDGAGLAYWRVVFGAVVAWEAWRFLDPAHGWVEAYYTGKDFYFTYWPFTFVQPLPEPWIYVAFYALGLAALMVAFGLFYRASATVMFLGLSYVFLLEKARYLNHFYLIILLAFLMIFVPANRVFSLDARRRRNAGKPGDETVPAWSLWLIRFQIGVPYFFGGIAKLNEDWLRGEPLRDWLQARTDFPLIGGLFEYEPMVWLMTYAALVLDLFVVFALLNRKARLSAFGAVLGFHLLNARLFNIGVFPWTMILGTIVFFDADWPRRVWTDLNAKRRHTPKRVAGWWLGAAAGFWIGGFLPDSFSPFRAAIGALGVAVLGYHIGSRLDRATSVPPQRTKRRRARGKRATDSPGTPQPMSGVAFGLLAIWIAIQIVVPLRHMAIPGVVHWTEEGHRWAWHMKLRDKDSVAQFTVLDPATGEAWQIDNGDYLTSRQQRKMASRPDMVVQYAHYLEDLWQDEGYDDVAVRAEVWASLNGREAQRLVDPEQDLTEVRYPWWPPADWIVPLQTSLDDKASVSDPFSDDD